MAPRGKSEERVAGLSFRKRFLSARALRGGAEEENFVSQENGSLEECLNVPRGPKNPNTV